jgi:hypothetical protein
MAFAESIAATVTRYSMSTTDNHRKMYAFACSAQGQNVMSKNARAIVENLLKSQGSCSQSMPNQASEATSEPAPSADSSSPHGWRSDDGEVQRR